MSGRIIRLPVLSCFLCIVLAALTNLKGLTFMEVLIDDYITPMIGSENPDFGGLFLALAQLAGYFAVGILCVYLYNRIMVNVTQGTMRNLRTALFNRMEALPIKYLIHMPTVILCLFTPMMWIRSASLSARVFRRQSILR